VLAPLHAQLEAGPSTQSEAAFSRAYGRDLQEAFEWCRRYSKSKRKADLSQAWDIYYQVFRVIAKQLPTVKSVHLRNASPRLLEARDLQLAIPGSYEAGRPIVRITSFKPVLTVISSKQRPRKIEIRGSDDKFHLFLLKGHEDTRQDERVMQLFSLVNTLFSHDPETSKSHVSIRLYSVTPLSPHSGLIGWVGGHDTLNALITEYRESRGIPLKVEMKFMHDLMPAYDPLSLMQKVRSSLTCFLLKLLLIVLAG
jgi:FKBP12-rapamycin complex-associated protein